MRESEFAGAVERIIKAGAAVSFFYFSTAVPACNAVIRVGSYVYSGTGHSVIEALQDLISREVKNQMQCPGWLTAAMDMPAAAKLLDDIPPNS